MMEGMAFCDRCHLMQVGWNRRYLTHRLTCVSGLLKPIRILILVLAVAIVISILPTPTGTVRSEQEGATPAPDVLRSPTISDPAVAAIEDLLERHSRVTAISQARIARAVVQSARRHDVDPYLVASILLVESSANPFAISNRDAVGIMQIHVPTWGALVDAEQINLFRVEDNVDLGTRILKDYTARYGLWEGVARYLGASGATEEAVAYVARVQDIYGDRMAD